MTRPRPGDLASHWTIEPGVTFLNHGSFGACPRPVLEAQARLREQMERQPLRFFLQELPVLADEARAALAGFVGADPDDLVLVTNATAGVNTVLRSLPIRAGDELLTTDHEYNACRNALEYAAARAGARIVAAAVPFPVESPDRVVEVVLGKVTRRTRLALLDHVTSPTGIVFPVGTLVRELRTRGVETLVDGAHGPGMLPLDLRALGADYYTGNCHKWLCAPKGAAFLHVRREHQPLVRPLVISHGANSPRTDRSRFQLEFEWTGTDDPSPLLCVPEAIRWMGSLLPGGWPELLARNRALALEARALLASALGVALPCPDEMIGSLAALPLPDGDPERPVAPPDLDPLQQRLMRRHNIEVPVMIWPRPPKRLIRIAAQAYNTVEQFRWLAEALVEELRHER